MHSKNGKKTSEGYLEIKGKIPSETGHVVQGGGKGRRAASSL